MCVVQGPKPWRYPIWGANSKNDNPYKGKQMLSYYFSYYMAALQAQFRLVIQISESAVRRVLQFSSLPEKIRKSNRLQMSLQKQQFLWSRQGLNSQPS